MFEGFRRSLGNLGNFSESDQKHRNKPNMGSARHEVADDDLSDEAVTREIANITQRLENPKLTGGEREFLTRKLENLNELKRKNLGVAKKATSA